MKKTLKLLMLLIVIISCNQGSRITKCYNEETREYIVDTLPYNDLRDYLKLQITKNIDSLINEIKNEDCFFYAMLLCTLSAMTVAILPNYDSPFLFAIGIFSLYFVLTRK